MNVDATPPEVLAEWDRRLRDGATRREMATALGLTMDAARNRLRRWRKRQAGYGGHDDTPLPHEGAPANERDATLARLLDALTATQDALHDLDDRQPVVTIDLQESRPMLLTLFSDTHIGGGSVDHRQMVADMELVRDTDGAYAVHLGDHVDNFSPRVLPQGMLEQIANPALQWELCELFLRRHLTAAKLKAGVLGNHDAFSGAVGLEPCAEMYRRLMVPFLGHGGRVWLKVGGETYKLELRHDFGFKSSLNTTNSQRRLSELTLGADVVAVGHLHYPDLQHVWRSGVNQCWLRSSTYKRGDSYAESKGLQMGYAPSPPDMPGVVFWPDQHKALPFRRFQDGLDLLALLRR